MIRFKDFISETVCSDGGIRGLGSVTGAADGESSNYVSVNFATADQRNDIILQRTAQHQSLHTPLPVPKTADNKKQKK
jgi:hypothetical protein